MEPMTIIWIILAIIFVLIVSRGFRDGYKKGTKQSFDDIEDIFK